MINAKTQMGKPSPKVAAAAVCARWLGCSTPNLPADSGAKRAIDRLLPRSGWAFCLYFTAVVALVSIADQLSTRGGLAVTAAAALAGGAWCSLNFWRCRHTHCVVTATGWLVLALLALLALLGAALGHSLLGGAENIVFLAILLVGALVEVGWYASHRSHAIPSPPGRHHTAP